MRECNWSAVCNRLAVCTNSKPMGVHTLLVQRKVTSTTALIHTDNKAAEVLIGGFHVVGTGLSLSGCE
jgi:hypothetical protein